MEKAFLLALQEPRHQITLLCFLATFTAYVERVGFSIAYTAMAKKVNVSESTKGTVLSAFYWGYGVSQVNPSLCHCFSFAAHAWVVQHCLLDAERRQQSNCKFTVVKEAANREVRCAHHNIAPFHAGSHCSVPCQM